jgi:hypothetical protein
VNGIVESDAFPHGEAARIAAIDDHGHARAGAPLIMFLTRQNLSRRTALKGIGASIALPFLDCHAARRREWRRAASRCA